MWHKQGKLIKGLLHQQCTLCNIHQSLGTLPICASCFNIFPISLNTFIKDDVDSNFTHISSVCDYRHPVSDMIVAYKYNHDFSLLPVLVYLFTMLPKPKKNTLLVPVPSSKERLKERGFDHVYFITKILAKQWKLPIWTGVLRTGGAEHQKGLTRDQRMQNMQNQFYIQSLPPVGKRLLIIDDVCTTGSTISAMAECLSETRLHVCAYVLAHKL